MKCLYCGNICDGQFCCSECESKTQSYQEKAEKVNVAAIIFAFLAVMVVFAIVAIVFDSYLGLGIMFAGIGLIFVPYPYVTTEALQYMCIRTSILMMRMISAVCIVIGRVILCLYLC